MSVLLVLWVMGLAASVQATTYPAVNATNFPSGSYDDGIQPVPLAYRYFKPVGYNPADTSTKYPLVIFCHGNGEMSSPGASDYNSKQLNGNANGAMIFIANGSPNNQTAFPCFWLAPNWYSRNAAQFEGLINQFISTYNIDRDRIYITGLSGGGALVWEMLYTYPNRFAAAAPSCGWGTAMESVHKHIPLWAFHCADDGTVGVSGSDNAISNLRGAGADPIYTRYNTGGHGGAWTRAYSSTTPLVPWMMAQRRGQSNLSSVLRVSTDIPSANAAYLSTSNSLSFAGTTEDATAAVTSVSWTNLRPYPNTTGAATGTTSWTAGSVGLLSGSNPVRFLATGVAYSAVGNGSTTFSRTMNVYYSATADTTAPTVSITGPTTVPTYSTTSGWINLAGTASDNLSVTQVTWANDRGGNGTASGTTSWSATDIDLSAGTNVITVTARDAAGNTSTDVITVTYGAAPVNQAPVVNAGSDQTITLPAGATLSGSVTDDGLAPGSASPTAAWSKISGPGTVTFGNASAAATTATFSIAGTYVLRLTGSDGDLNAFDEVSVTVNAAASGGGSGTLVRFDFGSSAISTSGNWNNVTTFTTGSKITSAVSTTGTATGVGLSVTGAFENLTTAGSTSTTGVYPASAMQDSFFVQNATVGKVKLTGLNVSQSYNLTFFASRLTGGTNRVTQYKIGATTVTLDATDNTTNVVSIPNQMPAADGTIEVEVKNNVGAGYGYLGVLELSIPNTVRFDFGSSTLLTSGNWNNVTTFTTGSKITSAVSTTGTATGVGLSVTGAFENLTQAGSTSTTGVYPASAMQDSFFVQSATVGKVKLTGLTVGTSYNLTFFASRLTGGTSRVTEYKIGTTTVTLDATDNTTNVVSIPNQTPAADGTIEVEVKNNVGAGYGYLGVMEVQW